MTLQIDVLAGEQRTAWRMAQHPKCDRLTADDRNPTAEMAQETLVIR